MKIKLRKQLLTEAVATPTKKGDRQVLRDLKKMLLREDMTFQAKGAGLKVDRDNNIISDVKILGWKSINKNRRYNPKGVNPELYEGAVVNIDHPGSEEASKGPRPLAARFGEVTGIYKKDDGLYAKELHYVPTHELCESILYMAEHKPHLFGCSQNAFGDVWEDANGELVENVTDVRSVDLVSEPATTKGLYEGNMEDEEDTEAKRKKLEEDDEEMTEGEDEDIPLDDEEPDDADTTETSTETDDTDMDAETDLMDDMQDTDIPDTEGDMDTDTAPDSGGGIDITDETMSAMEKVFRSNLDPKTKKKKIGHLIDTHCNMLTEGVMKKNLKKLKTLDDAKKFLLEAKDPAVRKAGRAVVGKLDIFEVKKLAEAKETKVRTMVAAAKLPEFAVTEHFIRILKGCETEKEIQEAIEDRRVIAGTKRSNKPKSLGGGTELVEGADDTDTSKMSDEELKKHNQKLEEAFVRDALKV